MDLRFHWTKKILHAEIVRAEALDFFKEIKGGGKPRTPVYLLGQQNE
jgi:hypothetical protein